MKVIILFSVLLVGVLAESDSPNRILGQYDEDSSSFLNAKEHQPRPSVLTPEILDVLVRQQQEQQDRAGSDNAPQAEPSAFWYSRTLMPYRIDVQQQEGQQAGIESRNPSPSSSLGYWSTYPEAASFDAKIRGRLESSRVLSNKQDIRQKLMEIAEQKFNQCKGKAENEERACLGHSTGQVMQLVSAVERMSRNQE